jgi:hypothetical protein
MVRRKGRTLQQAAAKAGLADRETVAKYERLGQMPSQLRQARTYRTRPDTFADDWLTVVDMLTAAPELEAKALFDWLCEQGPGRYGEEQLRTFQRRVSGWRALNTERVLSLPQVRLPGEAMQTDGKWLTDLGVTIAGEALVHLIIHSVLPYSDWEWAVVAQSESFLAIQYGFQSAVHELGHVPRYHQTDSTTAATHRLKDDEEEVERTASGRGYNENYLALMKHHDVVPRTTHLNAPNENGDIEAANGAFARALLQHLLLRGSRDFASIADYEAFVQQVARQRNRRRAKRVAEEIAVMRPLTVAPLPERREYRVRVSREGTIRVLKHPYSLPSGTTGKQVTAWVSEWEIEVYYGTQLVRRMPRLTSGGQTDVNYRHVVGSLLRKPGGFRNYRYFDHLFPTPVFRLAWEHLDGRLRAPRAEITYLRILKLAADHLETDVEAALQLALESDDHWDEHTITAAIRPTLPSPPALECGVVDLAAYDQLLHGEADHDLA